MKLRQCGGREAPAPMIEGRCSSALLRTLQGYNFTDIFSGRCCANIVDVICSTNILY